MGLQGGSSFSASLGVVGPGWDLCGFLILITWCLAAALDIPRQHTLPALN